MRIYCDASWCPISHRAGIGLYDSINGVRWNDNIRAKTHIAAELVAILRGCLKQSWGGVVVSDCKTAVDSIKTKYCLKRHRLLCKQIHAIVKGKKLVVKWVSRQHKQQRRADRIAYKALRG